MIGQYYEDLCLLIVIDVLNGSRNLIKDDLVNRFMGEDLIYCLRMMFFFIYVVVFYCFVVNYCVEEEKMF